MTQSHTKPIGSGLRPDHRATGSDPQGLTPVRPVLHLSGEKLRMALETAIRAAEPVGGVERFVAALKLKSEVFQERLGEGRARDLTLAGFDEIVPLMTTVRRRLPPLIAARGWPTVHRAIGDLLHDPHVPGTADARAAAFCTALASPSSPLPSGARNRVGGELPATASTSGLQKELSDIGTGATSLHPPTPALSPQRGGGPSRTSGESSTRFLRDLAAELLHNVLPEHYPLMTRWVWDAKSNTGVLREIWHDASGDAAVDRMIIDIPDSHETFLVLREEISQFLSDHGIFRDMLWYVDLVSAQIYAGYIGSQGGAWLKTDFSAETDPLEHTRRILGLDRLRRGRVNGEVVNGELASSELLDPPGAPPSPKSPDG